ncbi:hypothetical protein HDV00_007162 [Rhizophlyctis rosea]|nr:hypothetical protein HDV00_007162 [Rhizophlyctis rosea]
MPPSLEDLTPRIREILATADLEVTTAKTVRRQLETEFGSLADIKKEVDALVVKLVEELPQEDVGEEDVKEEEGKGLKEEIEDADDTYTTRIPQKRRAAGGHRSASARKKVKSEEIINSDDDYDDSADAQEIADAELARRLQQEENGLRRTRSKPTTATPRRKARTTGSGGGGGGFTAPLLLSPALSAFCSGETMLARTEVVKRIWDYVKGRGLQDETDKRYILCDDPLKSVFNTNRVHMFQMNKILAKHLIKPEDSVGGFPAMTGGDDDDGDEDDKEYVQTPRKKKAPKPAKKSAPGSSSGKRGGSSGGFNKPQQLSADLAALIGVEVQSRPKVVKALWEYIKANELQKPGNKRVILCDERMQRVFGKASVEMFEMNKLLTKHLFPVEPGAEYDLKDDDDDDVKDEYNEEEEEVKDEDAEDVKEEYSEADD